jgi:DNA helicase MCM8
MPTKCPGYGCKSKQFIPQRGDKYDTRTVDWQKIRLQEKLSDEKTETGRVPRTVECEVTNDLVDLLSPGDVVCVSGIVKVLATDDSKRNKASQMYYLYIDVNSLVKASTAANEEDESSFTKDYIEFSKRDLYGIEQIHLQGETEVFKLLVNSLCPSIYGHEVVKAGLLLALFGGRRRNDRKMGIRSDAHMLIVGTLL